MGSIDSDEYQLVIKTLREAHIAQSDNAGKSYRQVR